MSSKKVNPNKMPLTKMDMKIAEKKWAEQLEQMKMDAISDATLYIQAVVYLALCNVFGFTAEQTYKVHEEFDRISEKIGDETGKDRNYSLETVKKELRKYDIYMEREWI